MLRIDQLDVGVVPRQVEREQRPLVAARVEADVERPDVVPLDARLLRQLTQRGGIHGLAGLAAPTRRGPGPVPLVVGPVDSAVQEQELRLTGFAPASYDDRRALRVVHRALETVPGAGGL